MSSPFLDTLLETILKGFAPLLDRGFVLITGLSGVLAMLMPLVVAVVTVVATILLTVEATVEVLISLVTAVDVAILTGKSVVVCGSISGGSVALLIAGNFDMKSCEPFCSVKVVIYYLPR